MHDVDEPKRRSAPSRRLSLAGVILVSVTVIATGLTIWDRREESIASYRREITNLGMVLAEQTARSMQAVDLALNEVQAKVLAAKAVDPVQLDRVMGTGNPLFDPTGRFLGYRGTARDVTRKSAPNAACAKPKAQRRRPIARNPNSSPT
jgi:hypothetical protein